MGMGEGSNILLGDRRRYGGTKDILGGATSRGTVKRSDVEMDVIFEVWAFCGRGTKTDFKDRSLKSKTAATMVGGPKTFLEDQRAGAEKKVGKIKIFVDFAFYRRKTETTFKGWKDWVTRHILFGVFIIVGRLSIRRRRKG